MTPGKPDSLRQLYEVQEILIDPRLDDRERVLMARVALGKYLLARQAAKLVKVLAAVATEGGGK